MGRRALFWFSAVLAALIVHQIAVRVFGPDANRWLGMSLLIAALLSVPPDPPDEPRGGLQPVATVARRSAARAQAPPDLIPADGSAGQKALP
jgi:hypothetical protein